MSTQIEFSKFTWTANNEGYCGVYRAPLGSNITGIQFQTSQGMVLVGKSSGIIPCGQVNAFVFEGDRLKGAVSASKSSETVVLPDVYEEDLTTAIQETHLSAKKNAESIAGLRHYNKSILEELILHGMYRGGLSDNVGGWIGLWHICDMLIAPGTDVISTRLANLDILLKIEIEIPQGDGDGEDSNDTGKTFPVTFTFKSSSLSSSETDVEVIMQEDVATAIQKTLYSSSQSWTCSSDPLETQDISGDSALSLISGYITVKDIGEKNPGSVSTCTVHVYTSESDEIQGTGKEIDVVASGPENSKKPFLKPKIKVTKTVKKQTDKLALERQNTIIIHASCTNSPNKEQLCCAPKGSLLVDVESI